MNNRYSWLFEVDSIGQFFKRLGIIIIGLILFVLYVIGSGALFLALVNKMESGYLFLSTSTLNAVVFMVTPAFFIITVVLYFAMPKYSNFQFKSMEYSTIYRGDYEKKKRSKRFKISFLATALAISAIFIYTLNNYYMIYEDRIVKHNIIGSKNKTYSYEDIKKVDIGGKLEHRGGISFYYKIIFNDNYTINVSDNMMTLNRPLNAESIDSAEKINEIIRNKHIERNIDPTNYLNLIKNRSNEEVRKYEDIFR